AGKRTDGGLALLNGGRGVWQFHSADKGNGKACFSSLGLLDGTNLVWFRPPDHPWHRGFWFSWKKINGVNYWEENRKTGLSAGRTEVTAVSVKPGDDWSARISMSLSYHPPGKPAVLTEQRTIIVHPPAADGSYRVDWSGTFTAGAGDASLVGGTHGGGYAGLSIRLAPPTRGWSVLNSENLHDLRTHGQKARWVAWSGLAGAGKPASIAMFDHRANVRHPSRWYVAIRSNRVLFNYFSPALLFKDPYTIPARKSITLRYRVLVSPRRLGAEALDAEWRAFCQGK
ncbi:MAG: PmoA family protein, partial [Planctomycetes bacterium]|nr:PmoA family protein [Planctomycetota bacterium]